MQLLPLSLCLLTLTGSTFSDGNGPVIVRVKEGDNGILPCKINKDILFERFEWKKDGTKDVYLHEYSPLRGQDEEFRGRVSHYVHELKNGNASIKISDTKVSDSGDYTCDFPNLEPKQTFTVHLVVGKAAKVSILKPEQTEDGFLLQCLVSDVSPGFKLNIFWFDGSGNKLIEQINNTESEKLHILQTTVKKSDTYRCVATMEELSHQVHSEVHVHIPESKIPLIVGLVCLAVMALIVVAWAGVIYKNRKKMKQPLIIRVTEGDEATLTCNIKNEKLESLWFEWKKDGKNVYLYKDEPLYDDQDDQFKGRVLNRGHSYLKDCDASITIYDTKESDSGDYTCNFPNLQPKQTFTVRLVVEKRKKGVYVGRPIRVTEGDDVTLPCNIKNNRTSGQFEWKIGGRSFYKYEGGPLSGQDDQLRRRVSQLKDGDASITIRNTKPSDSGVYTCHFPNLDQTFIVCLHVGIHIPYDIFHDEEECGASFIRS